MPNEHLSPFDRYLLDVGLPPQEEERELESSTVENSQFLGATASDSRKGENFKQGEFKESLAKRLAGLASSLDSPLFAVLPEFTQPTKARTAQTILWEEGWDSKGDELLDRAGLRETWKIIIWIWALLLHLVVKYRYGTIPSTLSTASDVSNSSEADKAILYPSVLAAVDQLVASSYHLETSISSAIESLVEVEGVSFGLGIASEHTLPSPAESSYSTHRHRAPSPLGSPFPDTTSFIPHGPQRNQSLRQVLAATISSTIVDFTQTQQQLKILKSGNETCLLEQHEAEAARERKEAIEGKARVDKLWEVRMPISTSTRDKRRTWDGSGSVGSFQSGGSSTEGTNARPLSPISPLKRSSSLSKRLPPSSRTRPMSASFLPLSSPGADWNGIAPFNSPQSRRRTSSRLTPEEEERLLTNRLESLAEELLTVRKGLGYKLISIIEEEILIKEWEIITSSISKLAKSVLESANEIKKAIEVEFGELRITTRRLSISSSTPMDSIARFNSIPSPTLTSNSSYKRRSLPYPATQNFGPANSTTTKGPIGSLTLLESKTTTMSTSIRSIVAKLHIVQSDARAQVRSTRGGLEDEACIDQLLITHNSIGQDLEALKKEWEESRILLRGVVRRIPSPGEATSLMRDDWGGNGENELVRSLGSIEDYPDDEEDSETLFSNHLEESEVPFDRAAYLDAQLSNYLPSPGLEQIYEGTVESQRKLVDSSKFSREERIKLAREKRESRDLEGTSKRGSMMENGDIVAELKDVLTFLKGRNKLPADL